MDSLNSLIHLTYEVPFLVGQVGQWDGTLSLLRFLALEGGTRGGTWVGCETIRLQGKLHAGQAHCSGAGTGATHGMRMIALARQQVIIPACQNPLGNRGLAAHRVQRPDAVLAANSRSNRIDIVQIGQDRVIFSCHCVAVSRCPLSTCPVWTADSGASRPSQRRRAA